MGADRRHFLRTGCGAASRDGWNLAELVDPLRGCRVQSPLNNRSTIQPAALPSPKVLTKVMESLKAALYPRRLGPSGSERGAVALREASIDGFVGLTLQDSLPALRDQTYRTGDPSHGWRKPRRPGGWSATEITSRFAAQLPRISSLVDADLDAAYLIGTGHIQLSRQRENTFRPLCWNCG